MKILFTNSARQWGGNEKWTVNAACGLAQKGHHVFLGYRSTLLKDRLWEPKVYPVQFPFLGDIDIITLLRIRTFLKRHSINVIIPTKRREYVLAGLAAIGLKNVRVVARLGIDRPLKSWGDKLAFCRLFDAVIVNSKRIVEVLAQEPAFNTTKCRVIYNGVSLPQKNNALRASTRNELGIAANDTLIIGIGRLAPQKRFDCAIRAFAQLLSKGFPVKLVIVGSGGDCEQLKALSLELNVNSSVIFTGERTDVSDLLTAADIFWLTSQSEGMPNVLLEAMAHGLPAIVFDAAGVSELIENGVSGVIVPMFDTTALVNATAETIQLPEKQKTMGLCAHERVAKYFSMPSMINSLETTLQDIIKKPNPPKAEWVKTRGNKLSKPDESGSELS